MNKELSLNYCEKVEMPEQDSNLFCYHNLLRGELASIELFTLLDVALSPLCLSRIETYSVGTSFVLSLSFIQQRDTKLKLPRGCISTGEKSIKI